MGVTGVGMNVMKVMEVMEVMSWDGWRGGVLCIGPAVCAGTRHPRHFRHSRRHL